MKVLALAVLVVAGLAGPAFGADPAHRPVTIWSEGSRLSGDLWLPPELEQGERAPAILLTHGWGGVKAHLNRAYAPQMAAEGFVVLTFDYRGWGESDGRIVAVSRDRLPEPGPDGTMTLAVREVREVVDPVAQIEDITNAIAYLAYDPSVDPERIGIWGSSYSGGHVITMAALDDRISAVVSQVGQQGGEWPEEAGPLAAERAAQRARGEVGMVPPAEDAAPGLRGLPEWSRMVRYKPLALAGFVDVPTLIIDAADEELFDRRKNGEALHAALKARGVETAYEVFPGRHYDIYSNQLGPARAAAIAWFKKHL
ncbi:MAG: alpha/beta fold hydrolase [Alphaproteobacteria bacterium]|nr:alpha/beta fold hydrolase [Alphaproteobacteria bacterium]